MSASPLPIDVIERRMKALAEHNGNFRPRGTGARH
jgi:hypothetical protein